MTQGSDTFSGDKRKSLRLKGSKYLLLSFNYFSGDGWVDTERLIGWKQKGSIVLSLLFLFFSSLFIPLCLHLHYFSSFSFPHFSPHLLPFSFSLFDSLSHSALRSPLSPSLIVSFCLSRSQLLPFSVFLYICLYFSSPTPFSLSFSYFLLHIHVYQRILPKILTKTKCFISRF